MRPKTQYQKRVVGLNNSLPPLSEDVIAWAKENALTHPAVRRKNNVTVCSMCGNAMVFDGKDSNVICLECGRKLQVVESETWKAIRGQIKGWFATVAGIDGIQLQRTFEIRCRYNLKDRQHRYYIRELCRHWISADDVAITALPRMMGQFIDCFPMVGKIELRGSSQMVYDYIADHAIIYPAIDLLPGLEQMLNTEMLESLGAQTALRQAMSLNQKL